MNRRNFIKKASIAGAAAAVVPGVVLQEEECNILDENKAFLKEMAAFHDEVRKNMKEYKEILSDRFGIDGPVRFEDYGETSIATLILMASQNHTDNSKVKWCI